MRVVHPLRRLLRHAFSHAWQVHHRFNAQALQRIEQAIAHSETQHAGEIRVVIESGLPLFAVLRKHLPRQRALQWFSHLRIWDTEHNNGVLIYLLLADRDVEIIADRGIHQQVDESAWQLICQQMEDLFRTGAFEAGVLHGIHAIGQHLATHFPPEPIPRNALSNRVVVG